MTYRITQPITFSMWRDEPWDGDVRFTVSTVTPGLIDGDTLERAVGEDAIAAAVMMGALVVAPAPIIGEGMIPHPRGHELPLDPRAWTC